MPTRYQRCDECDAGVNELAAELLCAWAAHKPLLDARVSIDYLFAFCESDAEGACALKLHGTKCLGLTRKTNTRERANGHADAEILIDGDWWANAQIAERRALLDHELYHLAITLDSKGRLKKDLQGRPVLQLRKHDLEIGWFEQIALRHGAASQERIQAAAIMAESGQFYWPEIVAAAAKGQL